MQLKTSLTRRLVTAALMILGAFLIQHFGHVPHALPGGLMFGMAWAAGEPTILYLISVGLVHATSNLLNPIRYNVAKTADYVVTGLEPCGTVFTTRGAGGAVNFTLPAPSAQLAGWWCEFLNLVDQNMTVTAATADTLVTDGDLTADSIAVSTASHKIGGRIRAYCDGTAFIASGENVGATYTIAT
jgi:hypothetical protein